MFSKCPTLSDKLTYSHYCEIMWFDEDKMNYYINISLKQMLSVRELRQKIKSNEYERLPLETKNKIKEKQESKLQDYVKDPILIKNNTGKEEI